ncbi:MAG: polysaccharide deacetylase family protein, partial [Oscillospiraceae bacterium]|nr:polysaccharide deacetylase family protein [Oscillospiraceae bacterium]
GLPGEEMAELRLYVDGRALAEPGLWDQASGRHYAPADAFLSALDGDFWAGEKEGMHPRRVRLRRSTYLWVEDFCREQGIAVYGEDDTLWCTSAAGDWAPPAGCRVPVLMYHGVGDDLWTTEELFVSPGAMEQQLRFLLDQGYAPLWFSDLKHADRYEKPVILTFDDSFSDLYTELFPLLRQYGVKATVFVIQGTLGWGHTLTPEQVREMADSGLVSIQCHTQYHGYLDEMDPEEQERELTWSKVGLLKLTNRQPYAIAYPSGRQDDTTLAICRKEYRFGVKMSGPVYHTGDDPLRIHRIYVARSTTIGEFAALLKG